MTSDSTDPKPTQISPVQLIIGIGIIIAIILISNTGDSTSNNEPPTFPTPTEQTSSEEVQETEEIRTHRDWA